MTDQQLLTLLQDDPEQGLAALMDQYIGLVYSIVSGKLSKVAAREDIEECTSDILYTIYKSARQIDLQKGSIKAYLCVIAKRKAVDRYRQLCGEAVRFDPLNEGIYEQIASAEPDTEEKAAATETRRELIRIIKGLGEPDSEIFIRKYFLGQSTKEIARQIQLKENTIDKKISRGLVKLRVVLGGMA